MIFSDIVHELFSDVRTLNMPIVEGPIEHHKSRLVSRETGDGLTVTYSGGKLGPDRNGAENGRASAVRVQTGGKPLDGTKPCARAALTFPIPPFPPEVDGCRFL